MSLLCTSSVLGNYCPISVVPVVAKILEKVVAQQLSTYFESSRCLSPFQGAYRRGKSAEQLLLVAVDYITQALDRTLTTCVAFLDLRKAFDSLDHHILLWRLNDLGVGSGALKWFTNYLSNRYQRVKFHHSYSTWGLVGGGIPQGIALGPLLFLVYVNNMPSQVKHGWLLQYADDTALLCSGANPRDVVHRMLSEDLLCLTRWISQSKMWLNLEKSSVMWFRPRSLINSALEDIVVDGTCLNAVITQKYLWIQHTSLCVITLHVAPVSSWQGILKSTLSLRKANGTKYYCSFLLCCTVPICSTYLSQMMIQLLPQLL